MRRWLPVILSGSLGMNLWVILVCLPAVHVGVEPSVFALCALPLAPLLAGAAFTLRPPLVQAAPRIAPVLLLFAYPALLLVPLAGVRELTGVNVYGPGNLIVAVAALCAYGAGALVVLRRLGLEATAHRSVPIQGWSIDRDAHRRRLARIGMLLAAALVPTATFAAAFIRPGIAADVSRAYGKSALAASVGIGAVALAIPVGVLLVYFGPPLRRPVPDDPIPTPARRLRSTILLLVVAGAACVALVLMRAAP